MDIIEPFHYLDEIFVDFLGQISRPWKVPIKTSVLKVLEKLSFKNFNMCTDCVKWSCVPNSDLSIRLCDSGSMSVLDYLLSRVPTPGNQGSHTWKVLKSIGFWSNFQALESSENDFGTRSPGKNLIQKFVYICVYTHTVQISHMCQTVI